jgi:hypothetical protein
LHLGEVAGVGIDSLAVRDSLMVNGH